MIQWCAYCQRFLGEVRPFDNYEVTHGICRACSTNWHERSDAEIDRARHLGRLHAELMLAARKADVGAASALVDRILGEGMRPVDALVGLLVPALDELGEAWAHGEVSVADEHRFSAFTEHMIEVLAARTGKREPYVPLSILLVNGEGNYHTMGVRIARMWLEDRGVSSLAVYPGLPAGEIVSLVETLRPATLGISISLRDQVPAVARIVESLGSGGPRIVLGGHAVKRGLVSGLPGTTALTRLETLVDG